MNVLQQRVISRALDPNMLFVLPGFLRLPFLRRLPFVGDLPARVMAFGIWPAHVKKSLRRPAA